MANPEPENIAVRSLRPGSVNLGVLALVAAAAGLASGLFLAFHFAPTLDEARTSVAFLESRVLFGSFLRGLHHWAGHFAVALAALHGLHAFWRGRHHVAGSLGSTADAVEALRAHRRRWVLGCLLLLVIVGFAYTGYLLPADARARTGLDVMQGVARSTPVAGEASAAVAAGGPEVSSATLVRLYAVHSLVLPVALFLVLFAFVGGWPRLAELLTRTNALGGIAVLGCLALLAWLSPAPLGPEFDPEIGAEGQPEWFFLWVNELLHRFGSQTFLVGAVLPGALVLLGIVLPWLPRSARARRVELACAVVLLATLGWLTAAALSHDKAHDDEATSAPDTRDGPDAPGGTDETGRQRTDGDISGKVAAVFKRFRCGECHMIDDDEDGGDSGPALYRQGTDKLPPFRELYTRPYFRLKVGDPAGLWPDGGMTYRKRAGLPTKQQLDLLEHWFFDAK